ncbi:MAG TPA: NADPH:quinone reductase [Terriglobales bacterium]|nr:NADPH:quinone reductase [Terriglobales bacterium]
MRAAYYQENGPARAVLKIGEQPTPEPGPGEVRVQVKVSGVNPSDVKSRRGGGRVPGFPLTIPHSDGAGIIDAVGAGVDPARIGERVWLWNGQWRRPFGTAAAFVALPAAQAVPLPANVSFEIGACLGIPLLTAWRAVHWRPIRPTETMGETMLVAGGAGSVGHYAVQLAKRAGYRVIASVSSAEKAAIARAAGAEAVVEYHSQDVAEAVRVFTGGAGIDRVVEVNLSANAGRYVEYLRHEGLAVVYGSNDWATPLPLGAWLVHGIELALFIVYELPPAIRAAAIAATTDLLADPGFEHRIAARFPLDRIAEAHEAVETGKLIGNVVVTLD